MARPLRIERPDAWCHVTTRGSERRSIYRDDRDRLHFRALLGEAVEDFGLTLHSFLMDNHFHRLLETPEANLDRAMQWLNVGYSEGQSVDQLTEHMVLGSAEFVRKIAEGLRGNAREQTGLRRLAGRAKLADVVATVEQAKGEPWKRFRNRYGDWGRDLALYLGREACGLKLGELGEAVGGIDYVSVSAAVRRFERRLRDDAGLARTLGQAQEWLRKQREK